MRRRARYGPEGLRVARTCLEFQVVLYDPAEADLE